MKFVIDGMKYNTDKMENVAVVEKWYQNKNALMEMLFPGKELGRTYKCVLWKSKKGNWLLTHEEDYGKTYGEAVTEKKARKLLMKYATAIYERIFGELPEA